MGHSIRRNAPCPCGSGRKFKHCCSGQDIEWVETDEGLAQQIELAPEALGAVAMLLEARDRGVLPSREWMEHQTVLAMQRAGVDPAIVHAYAETGLLIGERTLSRCTGRDLDEWNAAIEAWERQHGRKAARRILTDDDMSRVLECGPREEGCSRQPSARRDR